MPDPVSSLTSEASTARPRSSRGGLYRGTPVVVRDKHQNREKGVVLMYPSELRYSEEHEWLKLEDGNRARIGITEFAQKNSEMWYLLSCPKRER